MKERTNVERERRKNVFSSFFLLLLRKVRKMRKCCGAKEQREDKWIKKQE